MNDVTSIESMQGKLTAIMQHWMCYKKEKTKYFYCLDSGKTKQSILSLAFQPSINGMAYWIFARIRSKIEKLTQSSTYYTNQLCRASPMTEYLTLSNLFELFKVEIIYCSIAYESKKQLYTTRRQKNINCKKSSGIFSHIYCW